MLNKVSIKEVEAYWNARPCNIKHSAKTKGTIEYFNEVELWRYLIEPHTHRFPQFEKWKDKRVLEIGCGIGTDATNFCRAGAVYTGIELSKESASLTRQRLKAFDLDGRIIVGNAENLDDLVGDETFDLIYSMGVIHHSPNPRAITKSLPNYLNTNGEIRIMVYAQNSWKNYLIESGMAQPEAQDDCPQAITYTNKEARILFNEFNLDISQDFIFPWQIDAYKNKTLIKEPWFAEMPESMFRTLETKLGWHLLIIGKIK